MKRRSLLKLGALSLFGSALDPIFADERNTNKSCIFVYLGGGASQVETISPIMDAPSEFKSMTGFVSNGNGMELGGTFQKLITQSDKINVIRSFSHSDANHNSAQAWILTSHPSQALLDGSPQRDPSYGSMTSFISGANTPTGLPTYIKLDKLTYDKSAWLGAEHLGYEPDGELEPKVAIEKFKERIAIVNEIEKNNVVRNHSLPKAWSDLRNQAALVVAGNVSKAFKYELEKQETIERYNATKSSFGKNCLIARRLVENGCKFVSIAHNGWDMHQDLVRGFNTIGPDLDAGLATLIADLHDRGLSKDCLVVITTEFGRTSKINLTAGRDHQPGVIPLITSGGNYEQGRVIGSHDDKAFTVTSKKHDPFDLCATIFDHFNFKRDIQKIDNSGRPRYLLERGECIL